MVPQKPDKIIVLIDARDPVTFDKEFAARLKYSPYVTHMDPMTKAIRERKLEEERSARGTEDEDDPMMGKFALEVDPTYFGEFVLEFVANTTHQRHLSYVDYSIEPLPDEGVTTEDLVELSIKTGSDIQDIVEGSREGLVHLFVLVSGAELPDLDDTSEDEDEDDWELDGGDDADGESDPDLKSKVKKAATSMLLLDSDGDQSTLIVDDSEDSEAVSETRINNDSFVIGASRSIH